MPQDLDYEVTRLRDWRHNTDKALWGVGESVKDLMRWRKEEVNPQLKAHEQAIQNLLHTDEIAEKVSDAMKGRAKLELTVLQKLGAILIGAIAIADFVRSF